MKRKKDKKKAKTPKPGPRMGTCVDCGRGCYPADFYIVRGEVWRAAGMDRWDSGWLHRQCLEQRLGRKLAKADYLMWPKGAKTGGWEFGYHPDYLQSPEYLEH